MNLRDFENNIKMELEKLVDYTVYFQEYDPDSNKWNYQQNTFSSESQAKSFATGILRIYPDNGIIIKSKEYRLFFENGRRVKKYTGKESFILKSTPESHERFMQEVAVDQENEPV